MAEQSNETVSPDNRDMLQKMMQAHQSKVIANNENDRRALNQGFSKSATVYFKKNKKSQYHLDSECTKVFIEHCEDTIVKFNSRILTETAEIVHCNNVTLIINVPVKTLQIDMCNNINITFTDRAHFDTVIWAGVHGFKLAIGKDPESADKIESGIEQVINTVEDFKENFDQFIVRYVDGKLTQELVVRLANGFPTTDREADDYDRRQEKNNKLFENHVRQLLQTNRVAPELEKLEKLEEQKEGGTESVPSETPAEPAETPAAPAESATEENKP